MMERCACTAHKMQMYTQIAYARGHWQRPVWQGRFAGTVPAGSDDDSLVIAWLLLERRPAPSPRSQNPEEEAKGAPPPPGCVRPSCKGMCPSTIDREYMNIAV